MINKQRPSISIVIPVYNEEKFLASCLDSIAKQSVKPLEVIVVDNNSSDATAKIAQGFSFIKLVKEKRQGVIHARSTGYNLAKGEIIARIDADTILPMDWLKTLESLFATKALDAVSGSVYYYDLPFQNFFHKLDLYFRRRVCRLMKAEVALYGSNMAMRRSVWRQTRCHVCSHSALHEDFDLAIHSNWHGFNVAFEEGLQAGVSTRRFESDFFDFYRYIKLLPKTYRLHGLTSQRHMYPVLSLVLAFYLPIKFLHLGFDLDGGKFSLKRPLFIKLAPRVNPAIHHQTLMEQSFNET